MKRALIGFGGHAKEVMCQIGEILPCFVSDDYLVDGTLPLSSFDPEEYEVMVVIAEPKTRKKIVESLPKKTKFFSFIHPTTLILDKNIKIGDGSFIGAHSILTTNIIIGDHSILNRANQIGHDSIIGNYFSAMPGSIISGNCTIGDEVYLGTNSSVKEKINISNNVIIGLNSGVVSNINDSGTYVGLPAKKIK